MSDDRVDARPLTSVELLDAAVWREIGSEEAQPAAAFVERIIAPGRPVAPGALRCARNGCYHCPVQSERLYRATGRDQTKGERMGPGDTDCCRYARS